MHSDRFYNQPDGVIARFTSGNMQKSIRAVFKNYKKLGIIIPEFEGLEKGFCEI